MTETLINRPSMDDQQGQRARQALQIVGRHGFTPTPEWAAAEACYSECRKLLRNPAPAWPGAPKDGRKIAAVLAEFARKAAEHRDLMTAAADVSQDSQRTMAMEMNRALPAWFETLAQKFGEAAETFTSLDVTGMLNGTEDDETTAAFKTKARAALDLHTLAAERAMLGAEVGNEVNPHLSLWLLTAPPADDTDPELLARWGELAEAWPSISSSLTPTPRFGYLVDKRVQLSLAGQGQIAARVARWQNMKHRAKAQPRMTNVGQLAHDRERVNLPVA